MVAERSRRRCIRPSFVHDRVLGSQVLPISAEGVKSTIRSDHRSPQGVVADYCSRQTTRMASLYRQNPVLPNINSEKVGSRGKKIFH